MVRILCVVLAMVSVAGCTPTNTYTPPVGTVAIAFLTDTDNERWQDELEYLVGAFQQKNYTVITINVVDGDAKKMAEYLGQLPFYSPSAMIFASPDVQSAEVAQALESLVNQCQTKILCYDRLQQNTNAIAGLIASPYLEIGKLESDALSALPNGSQVELLAGPVRDNTAALLFEGAYAGIEGQLANGTWSIPSGVDSYEKAKLSSWSQEAAYTQMCNLLDTHYPNQTLPAAVLTGSDAQAAGVAEALTNRRAGATLPIITGVGNTSSSWSRIVYGKQTMTVAHDAQKFADTAIEILEAWHGKSSYPFEGSTDNGLTLVPTTVISPVKALYKKDFDK